MWYYPSRRQCRQHPDCQTRTAKLLGYSTIETLPSIMSRYSLKSQETMTGRLLFHLLISSQLTLYLQGTWPFMYAPFLMEPVKLHTIQDDIESFIYFSLYLALLYLKHNRVVVLEFIMGQILGLSARLEIDQYTSGFEKTGCSAYIEADLTFTNNPPLTFWLSHVLGAEKSWHEHERIRRDLFMYNHCIP